MSTTTFSIPTISHSISPKTPFFKRPFNQKQKPNISFTLQNQPKRLNFSVKSEKEPETNSNVGLAAEHENNETDLESKVVQENEGNNEQQELDWKNDEEFKKFMGNPSIEAAIKLEKKRTDRKLKQLDRETKSGNLIDGLFNKLVRDNLYREKQRLEEAEQSFKALDLNKVMIKDSGFS